MSCGLGAVVLIFMLVKFQTELPQEKVGALLIELIQLEKQNEQTDQSAASLQARISAQNSGVTDLSARLKSIRNDVTAQKSSNESLKQQVTELEKKMTASPEVSSVPVPLDRKRLQNYLLGLKVEGRKIVMLIDSSASMTDERIVDIIKHKVSPPAQRIRAPKWQRTKRILEWLLARAPAESEYMVIHFNDKAKVVGQGGWKKGGGLKGIGEIKLAFSKIAPNGGTNLDAAISMMKLKAKGFTNVYVVTDGLPTKGGTSHSIFSGCKSILGKATTISSECRVKLLKRAIADFRSKAVVNVVLLPLEGDTSASPVFWQWTSNSDGLLIAPEASWP